MPRILPLTLLLSLSPLLAEDVPQIFLDKAPRIVAYQLRRLTLGQLVLLERKIDDKKYIPVYQALLTRPGITKDLRAESITALTKLQKTDAVGVLVPVISSLEVDDAATLPELTTLLLTQPPATLAAQHDKLKELATSASTDPAKSVGYAALVVADAKPDAAWELATQSSVVPLALSAVPLIPDTKLRAAFAPLVAPLLAAAPDEATRIAALDAASAIPGDEAKTFATLADIFTKSEGDLRAAAARSLRRIPASKWPKEQLAPLAAAAVKAVESIPAERRTEPGSLAIVQLGNDLAAALPAAQGAPIRKSLRSLSPQLVTLRTLHELMQFDLRWFAVEAGKPVQIVIDNTRDAMQHNLVVTVPGAMTNIAVEAIPLVHRNFVPRSPKVLAATPELLNAGQTATLSFTAPAEPGEYDFLCTFPGHFVRMYGTMLVVKDLDAWEQNPTTPTDPNPATPSAPKKPYASQHNEAPTEK
jgi:azurin